MQSFGGIFFCEYYDMHLVNLFLPVVPFFFFFTVTFFIEIRMLTFAVKPVEGYSSEWVQVHPDKW